MRHRLNAFGLDIDAEWPLPGSHPAPPQNSKDGSATSVRFLAPEHLEAPWTEPAEQLSRREDGSGEAYLTIDRSHRHYRLWLRGCGRFLVAIDGSEIYCERGPISPDRQERFLLAQVLPLAAGLHGCELLHASAVRAGTEVIGFIGASGTGKTSLASRLVLRGADLVADDVVALTRGPDGPLAHPGTPLLMCREEDRPLWESGGRLGPVVGRTDKLHVSVPTIESAMPLRRLYFLEQADCVEITPLLDGNVRRLLACVFVAYLRTPERLERHLETARLVSASVDQFRLRVPRVGGQDTVLEAVEAHLEQRA